MFSIFRHNSERQLIHRDRSILSNGCTVETRLRSNTVITRLLYKSFGCEVSQRVAKQVEAFSLLKREVILRIIDPSGTRERLFMALVVRAGRTGRAPAERQLNTDAMQPDQGRRSFDWLGIGRFCSWETVCQGSSIPLAGTFRCVPSRGIRQTLSCQESSVCPGLTRICERKSIPINRPQEARIANWGSYPVTKSQFAPFSFLSPCTCVYGRFIIINPIGQ